MGFSILFYFIGNLLLMGLVFVLFCLVGVFVVVVVVLV